VSNATVAADNASRNAAQAVATSRETVSAATGAINLVKSADLSNTSAWRVNTVVVDRVLFSRAADGIPVPIDAHRVDERTHLSGENTCYGQFPETNLMAIDPMKSYKVGIWIKSTGRDMRNYFVILTRA